MKNIFIIACCLACFSFVPWESSFDKAKQVAKEKHIPILLNFSGSDWCGPCIRMKKEIFESKEFLSMAETNLVLVNADFPRNKKHQLSKDIKKQNEKLADKYNPDGKFPFTVLLDEDGKLIRSWDGFPEESSVDFSKQIKTICDAHK